MPFVETKRPVESSPYIMSALALVAPEIPAMKVVVWPEPMRMVFDSLLTPALPM